MKETIKAINIETMKRLCSGVGITKTVFEVLSGNGIEVLQNVAETLQQDQILIFKIAFQKIAEKNQYGITDESRKSIEKKIDGMDKRCIRGTQSQEEMAGNVEKIFASIPEESNRKQVCDAVTREYIDKRAEVNELFELAQAQAEADRKILNELKQMNQNALNQLLSAKVYPFFTLELLADYEEAEEFVRLFSEKYGYFDDQQMSLIESEKGDEFTLVDFNFVEPKTQEEFMSFIDDLNYVLEEEKFQFVSWSV